MFPFGTCHKELLRYPFAWRYSVAGFLTKVELYDGSTWQPQAEMAYDGLGNRLEMTAYAEGQSLTTHYLLDGNALLAATADGQTTYYLQGYGLMGEMREDWSFYLADGTASVRQLTDPQGAVTLTRSFTPWGELLALTGTGDFSWGYLGGLVDAATGLVYVGNGQYYDPATGRFLSRGVYPGSPNPYVPWQGDPLGMLVAPLVLLTVFRGKRKAGKIDRVLMVVVVVLVVGVTVTGCSNVDNPNTTATPTVAYLPTLPAPTPTQLTIIMPTQTPQPTGTPTPEPPTPTPLPCPTPTPTPIDIEFYSLSW